jgi:hypothetical protein
LRGAAVNVADSIDTAPSWQFGRGGRKLDHDDIGYQPGGRLGKG